MTHNCAQTTVWEPFGLKMSKSCFMSHKVLCLIKDKVGVVSYMLIFCLQIPGKDPTMFFKNFQIL